MITFIKPIKIEFDVEQCLTKQDDFITDNPLGKIDYDGTSSVWLVRNRELYLPHGHEKQKDVEKVEMLFCEADDSDLSLEQQIVNVEKLGLPHPNKILFTGNKSLHFYWRCKETDNIKQWKFVQHLLAALIPGGDHALAQTQRQLRLPGVIHKKTGLPSAYQRCHNEIFSMKDIMDQLVKIANERDKDIVKKYHSKIYDDPSTHYTSSIIRLDNLPDPDRAADILGQVASLSSWCTDDKNHSESNAVCYSASLSNVSTSEISSILQDAGVDDPKIKDIVRAVQRGGFTDIHRGYLFSVAKTKGINISNSDYKSKRDKDVKVIKKVKKTDSKKIDSTEHTQILSPMETMEKHFGFRRNVCDTIIYDRDGKPVENVEDIYLELEDRRIKVLSANDKSVFLTKVKAYDYAKKCADKHSFNPVTDQLKIFQQKLKGGYEKMDTNKLATKWLNPDATDYENAVFYAWAVGAIKRLVTPGCKADIVMILTGEQGAGKSSFLDILGGNYYSDLIDFENDPDMIRRRRQAWICEVGELNHTKKEAARIKASITAKIDEYVPKYKNEVAKHPRHYVFAGTTNDLTFLNDPTGNRRYGIVSVAKKYTDQSKLKKLVIDFWANILQDVLNGASADLPKEMEEVQREDNANYNTEDPFMDKIQEYVDRYDDDNKYFTTAEIWLYCFEEQSIKNFDPPKVNRVANILKMLGYKKKTKRIDGEPKSVYVKLK